MTHTYLTETERHQIECLHVSGQSDAQIGRLLGRHRSTIWRERKHMPSEQGYVAKQAQALAEQRQLPSRNARTIEAERWLQVQSYVRLWLSPEQICGRLALEGERPVSHESIYLHIYRDKDSGGDLLSYLRCQKKRRKRYGSGHERRGTLTNRVGIEHRPAVVDTRQRLGDWEGDTVIGKGHQGVLVTLVERKSRFTLARALPCRRADVVQEAIIELLGPHKQHCLTITFDLWQGVCRARVHRPMPGRQRLFRPALSLLGAWHQREHQRPAAPVLPQTNEPAWRQRYRGQRGLVPPQPQTAQMPGLSNSP